MDMHLPFDNSYARLPGLFYSRLSPTPVAAPSLICVNHELAYDLGIDPKWLESQVGINFIAGNHIPRGADPIATVYAGYQFGTWNPQLGDGRALLMGELLSTNGIRYDLQLKGSGPTPYSRGGDGRAPLGPVLREYLVSEAMAVLGIPTTRSLAAVTTGEDVMREVQLPGGVLARVARSHIRVGTFQFFAARKDDESLRLLADHVIQRHYPDAAEADNPYKAMLDSVISRQASLIASWQLIGFIHGVMNTDNMLLSGETIDYGPCAFMDVFHPETVFSSIDHGGRYAYRNQPGIAHWNLATLAEALMPLLDTDPKKALSDARDVIDVFPDRYADAYQRGMCRKLGLTEDNADDKVLVQDLLSLMAEARADFTITFRHLSEVANPTQGGEVSGVRSLELGPVFDTWLTRWRQRLDEDNRNDPDRRLKMLTVNPLYLPRNHLIESVIDAAVSNHDLAPFHRLMAVLSKPCERNPVYSKFELPPRPDQVVQQTFCGT